MASAEREPITGVLGQSPQRGPGESPRWGVMGKPPEAECFFYFACPKEAANLPHTPITDNGQSFDHTVNERFHPTGSAARDDVISATVSVSTVYHI